MKITDLSDLSINMSPEEESQFKAAMEGCTVLRDAMVKVITKKVNLIDKELNDINTLSDKPKALEYIMSCLAVKNAYNVLLSLLS